MKTTWKEIPVMSKVATISSFIVAVTVIVMVVLQIIGVWKHASYVYLPLISLNMLLQAYSQWNPRRHLAIISLCAAAFILICFLLVSFVF